MTIRLYALHDSDLDLRKREGAFEITYLDNNDNWAFNDLNDMGYGIFWTVNDYEGDRKAENVIRINYWYCDIDEGSKEEQWKKIESLSVYPTMIVESKKGFHCYWKAKDGTIDNFRKIEEKIIEFLGGDKHCKDSVRLLRVPYMNHMKDKDNPYMCDVVENNDRSFYESTMLNAFNVYDKPQKTEFKGDKRDFLNPDKWEMLFKISRIREGNRNGELYRISKWLQDEGLTDSEVSDVINAINNQISPSLPDSEVRSILRC